MNLSRVRWVVRLVLAFGVAASITANVLHAEANIVSQAIAGWPPLALLLTIELVSRVPVHRRSLMALRVFATAVISGIAGWISYWHMAGVASRYGETGSSPYLLPISVDGLIIVASVSLVELAAKIRESERKEAREGASNAYKPGQTAAAESSHGDPQAATDPLPVDVHQSKPDSAGFSESLKTEKRVLGGDDLKVRAAQWVRDYTGTKTLTGQIVGDEFSRSSTWGRSVLRDAKGIPRAVSSGISPPEPLAPSLTRENADIAGVAGVQHVPSS